MVNSDDRKDEKDEEFLHILKRRITRREALSKVGTAATVAGVAVVAGVGGVLAGQSLAPTKTITSTFTKTETAAAVTLGATPAERAVNAVKQLRAEGKIPAGTKLRLLQVGFAKNNLDPEPGSERPDVLSKEPYLIQKAISIKQKWVDLTGIPLEYDIVNDLELYSKGISEGITKAGTWDLMSQRIDFLYDFIGGDVIIPIGEFEKKYQGDLRSGPCAPYPVFISAYETADGELWGFPLCGDWFTYFNRRDIVTDPEVQEAFERAVGYPLPLDGPTLWDQVLDMARFFDDYKGPQQSVEGITATLRGGYFFRDNWFSNIEFYIRFYQQGGLIFDRNKNVTINGPIARKALEDMKALVPYQSNDAFLSSWPTMYPDYGAKKVFQTISWASLPQFQGTSPAAIDRGFGAYHIPGYVTNGKLIRTTVVMDQTSYVVAKWGKTTQQVPELPYLLGQFLADPEISTQMLANPGSISDHFRTCHATDERLIRTFTSAWPPSPGIEPGRRGAMEAFDIDIRVAVLPLRLQGLKEIQDLWGTQMNAYFTNIQDVDTTLGAMQRGFEAIVDRFGRDKQFERYQWIVNNFPGPLKELHGIA